MHILRNIGLSLATILFSSLLMVFAVLMSIFAVFDKPEPLLGALQKSGIYNSMAPTVFDQQASQQEEELALDNPAIRQAVINAFPPDYLKSTVETNIHSIYDWVHGKTTEPTLKADLTAPREMFSQNIGAVVKQKLASVPPCQTPIATPTTPAELLGLTCKPPRVPDAALIETAERQAATSSLFAGKAEQIAALTSNDGRPITDQLDFLPQAYRYFTWSLIGLPIILVICASIIVFWAQSKRRGLKVVGRILTVNGIIGVLLALAATWGLQIVSRFIIDQNATLVTVQNSLLKVAQDLGLQLRNWLLAVAAAYVILGIIAIMASRAKGDLKTEHNKDLNESMGYRNDLPTAGTTFNQNREIEPQKDIHTHLERR